MSDHKAVATVVERIKTDVIGGAADTAKEVIAALASMVQDSTAADAAALAVEVEAAVVRILRVMPTLAPPINALHRFMGRLESEAAQGASIETLKRSLAASATEFQTWAESALVKVAQYGAEKVRNGDRVFMYSMSSTVWRILARAKAQGKSFEVVVTESRPGNEGLWTVKEMERQGIPVSISIDACVGELIPGCDVVFVGADAISSYGACLCKAGTYPSALVAKSHGVPFYVAADTLKLDSSTLLGLPFRVDPIHREEVLGAEYGPGVKAAGYIFDETPPELVTALITELGLLSPASVVAVMWEMKLSDGLNALVPKWVNGQL